MISKYDFLFLSLTGTWLDENFKYFSKVLSVQSFTEKHNSENISFQIENSLNNLEISKNVAVVAATRDGAKNISAACRLSKIPR